MNRGARTLASVVLLVAGMAGIEVAQALTSHERFGRLGSLFVLEIVALLVLAACVLFEGQRFTWRLLGLGTGWAVLLLVPSLLESEWAAGHGLALARPGLHGWVTPAVLLLVLVAAVTVQVHHVSALLFKRTYE